ncbi:MAG: alpha-1,2-fucosyltransferase [Methylococcaceae bacterium]|nr:alpha-1,2-fucosyltransferase [Methylococcaceae bacterium]
MIISHILGGIGNQMFQYAAGRALSLVNNQQFLVDLSDFSNYRLHHGFELTRVFNLNAEAASIAAVNEMLGWRANRWAKRVLRRPQFVYLRGRKFIVEPHFNYWPDFVNLQDNCYLYGYWQSEKYFKQFESTIRHDFTFREPLTGHNAELAIEMKNSQSVSLHVRRGDYVSNPKNSSLLEVCSLDYYHKAISYIAERIEHPVFYIFSDDIEWVRQNLPMGFPYVYVDNNRLADSYKDMQLMGLCRHHIIANSSFSWWGAWLNANPEKLVIAPKNWFSNGNNDCDLIPDEWVRL